LASVGGDKTARVWDAGTGKEVFTFKGHTADVWGVAFSPNGKRLATGSWDKTVKVWQLDR
jgi:COMPASS component SWD3